MLAEEAHSLHRGLKGGKEELAREKFRLAHHRSLAALLGAQGVGIRAVHYIGEPDEIEFEAPDDDPFGLRSLVGVLTRAGALTAAVIEECFEGQSGHGLRVLPALLASAAGLAADLLQETGAGSVRAVPGAVPL